MIYVIFVCRSYTYLYLGKKATKWSVLKVGITKFFKNPKRNISKTESSFTFMYHTINTYVCVCYVIYQLWYKYVYIYIFLMLVHRSYDKKWRQTLQLHQFLFIWPAVIFQNIK